MFSWPETGKRKRVMRKADGKLTPLVNLGGSWHEKLTLLVTRFSLPILAYPHQAIDTCVSFLFVHEPSFACTASDSHLPFPSCDRPKRARPRSFERSKGAPRLRRVVDPWLETLTLKAWAPAMRGHSSSRRLATNARGTFVGSLSPKNCNKPTNIPST